MRGPLRESEPAETPPHQAESWFSPMPCRPLPARGARNVKRPPRLRMIGSKAGTASHPSPRARGEGRDEGAPPRVRARRSAPSPSRVLIFPVPCRPLPASGARNAECHPPSLDTPRPAFVNGRTRKPAHVVRTPPAPPGCGPGMHRLRCSRADRNRLRGRSSAGRAPRSQ
jgi:hypothetical protein